MRLFTLIAALAATSALAQNGEVCEAARPLDGQRLLRRLSLDLRNSVPGHAEQLAQGTQAEVSASVVDGMLQSEGFVRVMRRYHSNMLWPNIDSVEVDTNTFNLIPTEVSPGVTVYWSPVRSLYFRTVTRVFVPCLGVPATFDSNGYPVTTPLIENGNTTALQEGYVDVQPYWAPTTTIKVCALDAQAAISAPNCSAAQTSQLPYLQQICDLFGYYGQGVGIDPRLETTTCDDAMGILAPRCGCGPNLRYCSTAETGRAARDGMLEQELRIVDKVVRENRPYSEILTTKEVEVNGPLAHWLNYQSRTSFDVFGEVDATAPVPASLSYASAGWVPLTRTGRHSGLLTTAGYLLKFSSNRGRAHRFYNAFECSVFVPSGPLPSPSEACSKREDLTKRCGCNACHTALEPLSAHWGRFSEFGMSPLSEARYPKTYAGVCTGIATWEQLLRCVRFYQTETVGDEVPYMGFLKPYVFRTPDEVDSIEQGPSKLVQGTLDSGKFANCTVRKIWTQFMHRAPTAEEEATELPKLEADFKADGLRLRGLVKAIVSHPAYRRMP